MTFGKTHAQIEEEQRKAYEKAYRQVIPHVVFLWLPKRLIDNRICWLQTAWRFNINIGNRLGPVPVYRYILNQEQAINSSRSWNGTEQYDRATLMIKNNKD